jgi:hypothetical protein
MTHDFVEAHVTSELLGQRNLTEMLVTVREPVAQIMSNFRHIRREPERRLSRAARELDPGTFFDHFRDFFTDFQCRYLLAAFLPLAIEEQRRGFWACAMQHLPRVLDRIRGWCRPNGSMTSCPCGRARPVIARPSGPMPPTTLRLTGSICPRSRPRSARARRCSRSTTCSTNMPAPALTHGRTASSRAAPRGTIPPMPAACSTRMAAGCGCGAAGIRPNPPATAPATGPALQPAATSRSSAARTSASSRSTSSSSTASPTRTSPRSMRAASPNCRSGARRSRMTAGATGSTSPPCARRARSR